jgi:Glycosyltransferases involved in cell wall biogenesis
MDLSIIIPIYNVEKYIRACLESVFRQGLDEDSFEVILVNDGTEDKSMEMIQDIIESHTNIRVINQENQGLSMARNNGIAIARGQYLLLLDSDDLLLDNRLKKLLEKAVETAVDIVVADFIEMRDELISDSHITRHDTIHFEEKTGEQLIIEDLDPRHCQVWRTLYRRQFLIDNHIGFVPGICYEDIPFTHECFLKAKHCLRTDWCFYVYRMKRHGAITSSVNTKKAKDFCMAICKTWELTHIKDLSPQVLKKLKNNIFTLLTLLIYFIAHDIKTTQAKKDAMLYLRKNGAEMSFQDNIKQKAFTFLFKKMPLTLISIRHLYGIIFEDLICPYFRVIVKHQSNENY